MKPKKSIIMREELKLIDNNNYKQTIQKLNENIVFKSKNDIYQEEYDKSRFVKDIYNKSNINNNINMNNQNLQNQLNIVYDINSNISNNNISNNNISNNNNNISNKHKQMYSKEVQNLPMNVDVFKMYQPIPRYVPEHISSKNNNPISNGNIALSGPIKYN
jgi:hypothetical protein